MKTNIRAVLVLAILFYFIPIIFTKSNLFSLKRAIESPPKFIDGIGRIKVDGKYGYINSKGGVIIEPKYIEPDTFSEGLALVQEQSTVILAFSGKCTSEFYYIDKKGNKVISLPSEICYAESYKNGMARVQNNKFTWFVNNSGKIISAKYDYAKDFSEGLAVVDIKV